MSLLPANSINSGCASLRFQTFKQGNSELDKSRPCGSDWIGWIAHPVFKTFSKQDKADFIPNLQWYKLEGQQKKDNNQKQQQKF